MNKRKKRKGSTTKNEVCEGEGRLNRPPTNKEVRKQKGER